MKVLVLGGFGFFGMKTGQMFAEDPNISAVTLGDIHIDEKLLPDSLPKEKVSCEKIDITDHSALVRLIKKHNLVVNISAPYRSFGIPSIKAAIDAKTNYVDICDDVNVTVESLKLNQAAKDAGVSICVCCGAGPGLSNVFIKHLADQLDEVRDIEMVAALGLGNAVSKGIFNFFIKSYMEANIQYIDGQYITPDTSGKASFLFAEPIGMKKVYYAGYPETVMLPRSIPGVRNVSMKMCLLPDWLNNWLIRSTKIGLGGLEKTRFEDKDFYPRDFLADFLGKSDFIIDDCKNHKHSEEVTIIKGLKDGKEKQLIHQSSISPIDATVTTVYQVGKRLQEGKILSKGVLFPDEVIDAEEAIAYWKNKSKKA
jgi:lysine 6-dehydrogenase